MSYDKQDIGHAVKSRRLEKGWTQSYLSEVSGIGLRTIQRIENGEVVARSFTLRVLEAKLEILLVAHRTANESRKLSSPKIKATSLLYKLVLSYGTGIVIAGVFGFILTQSATFPETNFEMFTASCFVIFVFSIILLFVWKKNLGDSP